MLSNTYFGRSNHLFRNPVSDRSRNSRLKTVMKTALFLYATCGSRIRNSALSKGVLRNLDVRYLLTLTCSRMKDMSILLVHLLTTVAKLLGPGGAKAVIAENLLLKQQLLVVLNYEFETHRCQSRPIMVN